MINLLFNLSILEGAKLTIRLFGKFWISVPAGRWLEGRECGHEYLGSGWGECLGMSKYCGVPFG